MNLIPKMHGATSIWIAGMILGIGSIRKLDFISATATLAGLLMLFTVQGAHSKFFEGKKFHPVSVISPVLMITVLMFSELSRLVLLVYLPLFLLVYFARKSFRLYVILGSILLTLPYPFIASTGGQSENFILYWGLFAILSLWGVLLADQRIFSSSPVPFFTVLVAYTFITAYIFGITSLILFPIPVFITLLSIIKDLRTKTLGLWLLVAELHFAITVSISGYLGIRI